MSSLAPDLFDRRFRDFLEIGRARLRSLAPEWTDHNAHDPGITLMELLAWVAEAQVYSLSRVRRDERTAYAAMFGLSTAGTHGAEGIIWSDPRAASTPGMTYTRSVVLSDEAVIGVNGEPEPLFTPVSKLLWIPGLIKTLETRSGAGRIVDHTIVNTRGTTAFLPFGKGGGRNDVLALAFVCNDDAGLFGANRQEARGALWAIGVRAAPPAGGANAATREVEKALRSALVATFVSANERIRVPIVSDSTQGMLATGALMLDLSSVPDVQTFTIELRAPNGFARPPRILHIEPSVIPIRQGRRILRELTEATGMPDTNFTLAVPGLRFEVGEEPVVVEIGNGFVSTTWTRCERLSERGPDERAYECDAHAGLITFGNGVNGMMPPTGSQILVSYAVSDAERGNVARNRRWEVAGFTGVFGVNLDAVTGGAAPSTFLDQRRDARRMAREEHALVSSADIEAAAKALPLLEVVRAWVLSPDGKMPRTGVIRLIAMRSRVDGTEPDGIPETQRWLESIRRRLSPRIPLGTRLDVVAPRYVEFSIDAKLDCDPGRNPATIKTEVEKTLRNRLTLVHLDGALSPREFGDPITPRDVMAWVRGTEGVRRVSLPRLLNASGESKAQITVPRGALPKWNPDRSSIAVRRSGAGGAQ